MRYLDPMSANVSKISCTETIATIEKFASTNTKTRTWVYIQVVSRGRMNRCQEGECISVKRGNE